MLILNYNSEKVHTNHGLNIEPNRRIIMNREKNFGQMNLLDQTSTSVTTTICIWSTHVYNAIYTKAGEKITKIAEILHFALAQMTPVCITVPTLIASFVHRFGIRCLWTTTPYDVASRSQVFLIFHWIAETIPDRFIGTHLMWNIHLVIGLPWPCSYTFIQSWA